MLLKLIPPDLSRSAKKLLYALHRPSRRSAVPNTVQAGSETVLQTVRRLARITENYDESQLCESLRLRGSVRAILSGENGAGAAMRLRPGEARL